MAQEGCTEVSCPVSPAPTGIGTPTARAELALPLLGVSPLLFHPVLDCVVFLGSSNTTRQQAEVPGLLFWRLALCGSLLSSTSLESSPGTGHQCVMFCMTESQWVSPGVLVPGRQRTGVTSSSRLARDFPGHSPDSLVSWVYQHRR